MKARRANRTAPATPSNVTAQGATQQTPNARAKALKPRAPLVTPTTRGFSLITVSLCYLRRALESDTRPGLLNLLILRHRSRSQGLRAETPVLASALRG